jgi:hypothetical protein
LSEKEGDSKNFIASDVKIIELSYFKKGLFGFGARD